MPTLYKKFLCKKLFAILFLNTILILNVADANETRGDSVTIKKDALLKNSDNVIKKTNCIISKDAIVINEGNFIINNGAAVDLEKNDAVDAPNPNVLYNSTTQQHTGVIHNYTTISGDGAIIGEGYIYNYAGFVEDEDKDMQLSVYHTN